MAIPPLLAHVLTAPVNLNHRGRYLDWGVLHISWANVVVVLTMIVLFVLALVLPFPGGRRHDDR